MCKTGINIVNAARFSSLVSSNLWRILDDKITRKAKSMFVNLNLYLIKDLDIHLSHYWLCIRQF